MKNTISTQVGKIYPLMDINWGAEICGNTVTPTFWGVSFRSNNYPTSKDPRATINKVNEAAMPPTTESLYHHFSYAHQICSYEFIRWCIICTYVTYACSVCLPICITVYIYVLMHFPIDIIGIPHWILNITQHPLVKLSEPRWHEMLAPHCSSGMAVVSTVTWPVKSFLPVEERY